MAKVGLWFTTAALFFTAGGAVSAQRQQTRSPHGPLNIPCDNCHTNTSWAPIRAIPEFNHDSTRYPLRGMHEKVSCTGCHVKPIFTDVGKNCSDCHADIHRGQFGANCAQCHTPNGWQVSVQSIKQHFNRFPLLGAHAVVECDQCHKQAAAGIFQGLSTACASCHMADFQATTNPPHKSAGFETTCQDCHNSFDSWLNASFGTGPGFDHSKFGFPLTLAHAGLPCETCHVGGNYHLTTVLQNCGDSNCHLNTYNQTNNPPHAANASLFPIAQCSTCHPTWDSWSNFNAAAFNHSPTAFPLQGSHMVPPRTCTDVGCHAGGVYAGLATTCFGCHTKDYNNTSTPGFYADNPPNHVSAQFSQTCTQCHNQTTWTSAGFDHNNFFPLTGAHAVPPRTCTDVGCHAGGVYTGLPTNCYGCHTKDYNNTSTPNFYPDNPPPHAASGFPTTCLTCHNINTWTGATFTVADHNNFFPLTGAHAVPPRTCTDVGCHAGGVYTGLPTNCYGCHTKDYNNTSTPGFYPDNPPPHAASGFSTTCTQCHNINTWTGATFNHSNFFPLTNAHAVPPLTCVNSKCHVGGNYTTVPTACSGCHMDAYQSTVTLNVSNPAIPNHVSAQFPTDCTLCHDTIAWTDATFNHANTTFGALTGMHATISCATVKCHAGGVYTGLPTTCDGCHDDVYQQTATGAFGSGVPNHVALGYQKTCQNCHTTSTWLGAVFNHATTPFGALTGAHATIACTACHTSATPPPLACSGCHLDKWLSTQTLGGTIPNHVAAALVSSSGFSLAACSTCHTPSGNWLDGVLNHSWFLIPHHTAGSTCINCHIDPTSVVTFSCTASCHGGGVATNFKHPGVPGYVYSPTSCYQCHHS